jgi:hypothetical protein
LHHESFKTVGGPLKDFERSFRHYSWRTLGIKRQTGIKKLLDEAVKKSKFHVNPGQE